MLIKSKVLLKFRRCFITMYSTVYCIVGNQVNIPLVFVDTAVGKLLVTRYTYNSQTKHLITNSAYVNFKDVPTTASSRPQLEKLPQTYVNIDRKMCRSFADYVVGWVIGGVIFCSPFICVCLKWKLFSYTKYINIVD